MATGYETKPAAEDRLDAAAIAAGRDPGEVGRMIQLVGGATDTASTMRRPRSGAGNQAIHTTPEHWARIVAEFAVEERFDAVNFVFVDESSDQIIRVGAEVVAAARDSLTSVPSGTCRDRGALVASARHLRGGTVNRVRKSSPNRDGRRELS